MAPETHASFGPAAAALARARIARAEHYLELPRLALASAREAAERALEIDGSLYEAHLVLAETQRTSTPRPARRRCGASSTRSPPPAAEPWCRRSPPARERRPPLSPPTC
jgi:hypothetical protein